MNSARKEQTISAAMAHHQAGRLDHAEPLYRQVLKAHPDHPQALHFLGMLLHQRGRDDLAEPMMRRSIELDGRSPHYCTNLAEVLRGMGRNEEAAELCRRALSLNANLPEAHSCLGNALAALGRKLEAVEAYRKAIALRPNFGTAYNNLGTALQDLGRTREAAEAYRKAIALLPNFSPAHGNLGGLLKELGQLGDAEQCCRRAISLDSKNVQAHNALGNVLKALGQPEEAEESYRRAIELNPRLAAAYNNLGNLLKDRCALAEAAQCYLKAIELQPAFAAAHNNLGNVLEERRDYDGAGKCYQRASELRPDLAAAQSNLGNVLVAQGKIDQGALQFTRAIGMQPELVAAYNNLGNAMKDQGRIAEAIEYYRKAIAIRPDYADAHSGLLLTLHYGAGLSPDEIFAEHRRFAEIHEAAIKASIPPHQNDRTADRRIRVGYLSPDFRQHVVATFVEPILANHDHERFEVVCYCDVLRPDGVTERLRRHAEQWHSVIGMTDEQVAEKICADGIDILVDLAGHTANNRLRSLAQAAPVQVTYIGYPDTTGLSAVDYRITDFLADPPGMTERWHTEKLARLPGCFLCYTAPADAPEANDLPALERGHITFGSFNNYAKLTAEAMELWIRILRTLPGSHLVLKAPSLGDESVQKSARAFFAERGIAAERVELIGRESSYAKHLEHYHRLDIAVDTFPYCGTTTTCEAMWMGVPVVSLAGRTHVSRVGVSLLNSVGLGELVASSAEEYVKIVCGLAGDLGRLKELRGGLRERMRCSELMDGKRLAREVESAYREMWEKWCKRRD